MLSAPFLEPDPLERVSGPSLAGKCPKRPKLKLYFLFLGMIATKFWPRPKLAPAARNRSLLAMWIVTIAGFGRGTKTQHKKQIKFWCRPSTVSKLVQKGGVRSTLPFRPGPEARRGRLGSPNGDKR